MRITKLPFSDHVYAFSHRDDYDQDLIEFKEWLSTVGKNKYNVLSTGLLEISDPQVETMFILKWASDRV
jgi:hypothetical protein